MKDDWSGGAKQGLSEVHETLKALDGALSVLMERANEARQIQAGDVVEAARAVEEALKEVLAQKARLEAEVPGVTPSQDWCDREGFIALCARLEREGGLREREIARLEATAAALERAVSKARLRAKRERFEAFQGEAVEELEASARSERPDRLPGKASGEAWFGWWSGLDEEGVNDAHQEVEGTLPGLARFLAHVGQDPLTFGVWEGEGREEVEETAIAPTPVDQEVSADEEASPAQVEVSEQPAEFDAQEASRPVEDDEAFAPEPESASADEEASPAQVEVSEQPAEFDAQEAFRPAEDERAPEPEVEPAVSIMAQDEEHARGVLTTGEMDTLRRVVPVESGPRLNVTPEGEDDAGLFRVEERLRSSDFMIAYEGGEGFESFEAFSGSHWIDTRGEFAQVPWRDAGGFAARLRERSEEALRDWRLHEVAVFSLACERLGEEGYVKFADVEFAVEQLSGRGGEPEDLDVEALLATVEGCRSWWRLRLVCALMRTASMAVGRTEVSGRVEALFEDSDLSRVLTWLWWLKGIGRRPLEVLRAATARTEQPSAEELKARLERARSEFRKELGKMWSAAGGKVERSHCRLAWKEWVEESQEEFERYYPDGLAVRQFEEDDRDAALVHMRHRYRDIADRGGVKFGDRKDMDEESANLMGMMQGIVELVRAIREAQTTHHHRSGGTSEDFPKASWRKLSGEGWSSRCAVERLGRALLLEVAGLGPERSSEAVLSFTARDIYARRDMLRFLSLDRDLLEEATESGEVSVTALDVEEEMSVPLAAVLLSERDAAIGEVDLHRVLDRCRDDRTDLLMYLGPLLERRDRQRLEARGREARHAMVECQQALHNHVRQFAELAQPKTERLRAAYAQIEEELERDLTLGELQTLKTWCEALTEWARREVERTRRRLLEDLEGGTREQVARLLETGRLAEALGVSRGEPRLGQEVELQSRQTPYRDVAAEQYTVETLRGMNLGENDLAVRWLQGLQGNRTKDKALQRRFIAALRFDGFSDKDENPSISTPELREWLAAQHLNPSFVPQLALYRKLEVMTPSEPLDNRWALKKLISHVQRAYSSQDLVLILTPGLSEPFRRELLRQLQHGGLVAVAVDDVNVQRIVQAKTPILGALEVLFEEHRERLNPFKIEDEGQRVLMEMFVGRGEQARQLAHTSTFTRLFSGRKLGKSALLKYVEHRYDDSTLPSGYKLRVVYVSIPGSGTADDVVTRIVDALAQKLGLERARRRAEAPDAYLIRVCRGFTEGHPETSLLIVLDEADAFVEEDLREYQRRKEDCLSFKMRSVITVSKDKQGLPRVRFLVSGYRTTNTSAGTWANWGKVMRLEPLELRDAAELLRAPLERLGVDLCGQERHMAYQCGYQPAILLECGVTLLKRISGRAPHVKVDAHQVSQALAAPDVRDEIRTITRANFHDNTRGLLVFTVLLLESNKLLPGQGLANAAQLVHQRLKELGVTLDQKKVAEVVRDLEARELLTQTRGRLGEYRLKFPHHRATLLEDVPDLKQLARKMRQEARPEARVLSLLGDEQRSITEVVSDSPEACAGGQLMIVGTNWMTAVTRQSRGVPDCAGVLPERVFTDSRPSDEAWAQDEPLAVVVREPGRLKALAREQESALPVPLVIAPTRVLRAVLLDTRETLDPVEFYVEGLYRLPLEVVRWWFERVRCLDFHDASAAEMIHEATGGIPYMLRLVEELLFEDNPTRESVSALGLSQVLERFKEALVRLELEALGEDALTGREVELLRAVALASTLAVEPGEALRGPLMSWGHYCGDLGQEDRLGDWVADDVKRVKLLHLLGFLPMSLTASGKDPMENLVALAPEDPLMKLFVPKR